MWSQINYIIVCLTERCMCKSVPNPWALTFALLPWLVHAILATGALFWSVAPLVLTLSFLPPVVSKRVGSPNPEPSSLNPMAHRSDCLFGLIRACLVHSNDDPWSQVFFLSPSPCNEAFSRSWMQSNYFFNNFMLARVLDSKIWVFFWFYPSSAWPLLLPDQIAI